YAGNTYIEQSTLVLGVSDALPTGTNVVMGEESVLDLNNFNQTIGSLSTFEGVDDALVSLGSGALTVGNDLDTEFEGVVSGSGTLTKVGDGMLVLDGINTYTGGTRVAEGTLVIGENSLEGAMILGPVTVDGGAALEGFGTVA